MGCKHACMDGGRTEGRGGQGGKEESKGREWGKGEREGGSGPGGQLEGDAAHRWECVRRDPSWPSPEEECAQVCVRAGGCSGRGVTWTLKKAASVNVPRFLIVSKPSRLHP